ncbi:MAG: thermonuclease family protein [Candidatus Moranbacteria bacterium]|nr:thermonuclease family protein [Candidatus Moranbacteria bacterium]
MSSKKKITLTAMMAIIVAGGYGGYTLIKEKDLLSFRSGNVPTYKVERIIDGDTFEIEDGDVVRMLGVNAPEEKECYYEEAKEALKKIIEGKKVELRKDVTGVDDFGRLLRYVILINDSPLKNNILVDEYMVREGYGEMQNNPKDKLYNGVLLEAREKAEKDKKGLWEACDYAPSEHSQENIEAPSKDCTIKGNISTGEFGKTYFLKECNNYEQVKVDPSRGEKYFCNEKEAVKEGFVKARYCP